MMTPFDFRDKKSDNALFLINFPFYGSGMSSFLSAACLHTMGARINAEEKLWLILMF